MSLAAITRIDCSVDAIMRELEISMECANRLLSVSAKKGVHSETNNRLVVIAHVIVVRVETL